MCMCVSSVHLLLSTNDNAVANKHSCTFWLANKSLLKSHITMEKGGEYSRAPRLNYQTVKQWLVCLILPFFSHCDKDKQIQHTCSPVYILYSMFIYTVNACIAILRLAHMKKRRCKKVQTLSCTHSCIHLHTCRQYNWLYKQGLMTTPEQ